MGSVAGTSSGSRQSSAHPLLGWAAGRTSECPNKKFLNKKHSGVAALLSEVLTDSRGDWWGASRCVNIH